MHQHFPRSRAEIAFNIHWILSNPGIFYKDPEVVELKVWEAIEIFLKIPKGLHFAQFCIYRCLWLVESLAKVHRKIITKQDKYLHFYNHGSTGPVMANWVFLIIDINVSSFVEFHLAALFRIQNRNRLS